MYVVVEEEKNYGSLETYIFEEFEEAKRKCELDWQHLSKFDKKRYHPFMVLLSENTEDLLDGNIAYMCDCDGSKSYRVFNIDWDTESDGEKLSVEELNLPKECVVVVCDECDIVEELSDTYGRGRSVNSFDYEEC